MTRYLSHITHHEKLKSIIYILSRNKVFPHIYVYSLKKCGMIYDQKVVTENYKLYGSYLHSLYDITHERVGKFFLGQNLYLKINLSLG